MKKSNKLFELSYLPPLLLNWEIAYDPISMGHDYPQNHYGFDRYH